MTEDQLTPSFKGEVPLRRRNTSLLGELGPSGGGIFKLSLLLRAGQSLSNAPVSCKTCKCLEANREPSEWLQFPLTVTVLLL